MVKAADVDWGKYFLSIQKECPWSIVAWTKGKIDIAQWSGKVLDLGDYRARVYVVKNINKRRLKKIAKLLDQGSCEWLWSYPGCGSFATPVPVLIQQNRQELNDIRKRL